ncbi:MAG: glycosyltransferase family 4 protein [Clostridia bacterium]|nr:glycosyltransferase family 4 protein [Clostridia bacterium]
MKILLVNKFHYLKGGSEKYYFELGELLKEHGHEVAWFSMEDDKNITTGDKEYFVEKFDLNNGSKLKALDVIYSKENKKLMEKALDEFKPDIVHLNNFQRQLSASIVNPIKERNIPIVFTAHDVQAVCPAITMLDNDGNICEKCMGGKYINCVKKKCNKGSTLKSLLGAIEGKYYRNKKIYTEKIESIITPSSFYKEKLIEDGIEKDKIIAIHNFIKTSEYEVETTNEGYALYVGRLSKEKGILDLIDAFKNIENGKLLIAGDGPEKENIQATIKENSLEDRIELLGFLDKKEIIDYISKCSFVVIPSIWYENCPYSALETQAIGKAIIGANIGGIPELVDDGKEGLLFESGNTEDLQDKMELLLKNTEKANKMGMTARNNAKEKYSIDNYYNSIIKVYESLL